MNQNNYSVSNANKDEMLMLDLLSTPFESSNTLTCNNTITSEPVKPHKEVEMKSYSLTTKKAIEFLLNGTLKKKVCRYCLKVTSSLSELDQVLHVASGDILYKVTIRDMVASFHPIKVADDPNFPTKICDKCLDNTIRSYLFKQQCERSERALRNCFEDIFDKLEKLDPLERQKRRGRQKSNPNPNVLYSEHYEVIDYAEPLITIVNACAEFISDNPDLSALMCSKCSQVLPNIESLLNHEKSHPKSMWYHCRHCGKSFPKRNHLKKHLQAAHNPGKLVVLKETDFKCQDCGTVSSDYNNHIQHIEKHKFKTIMEHLISKKMDQLCTLCLNKDPKLVDMEQMICIHGGYPEMMGDMTLYNVLGSTIPEKSSFKYQELLIPSQAKILQILNSKDINKYVYVISSPIIISNDNIDHTNLSSYHFSLPNIEENNILDMNDNTITNAIEIEMLPDKLSDGVNSSTNSLTEKLLFNIEKSNHLTNPTFIFSKPMYNIQMNLEAKTCINVVEKVNAAYSVNTIGKCKTCWIFKKPTCKVCLTDIEISTEYSKQNVEMSSKSCQMCWLFQDCKQCDNCKQQNWCNFDSDPEILHEISKADVILDEVKIIDEANENVTPSSVIEEVPVKKRKIIDVIPFEPKKLKWQCQICLTDNSKRELCLCCDSPRFLNDKKLTFNLNKNIFNTKHIKENLLYVFNAETIKDTLESDNNVATKSILNNCNEFKTVIDEKQNTGVDFNFNTGTKSTTEHVVDKENEIASNIIESINEDEIMAVEVAESPIKENINTTADIKEVISEFQPLEKMDISEDINQMHEINAVMSVMQQTKPNFTNRLPQYSFNIGTSVANDKKCPRKFKRAVRRVTSS